MSGTAFLTPSAHILIHPASRIARRPASQTHNTLVHLAAISITLHCRPDRAGRPRWQTALADRAGRSSWQVQPHRTHFKKVFDSPVLREYIIKWIGVKVQ